MITASQPQYVEDKNYKTLRNIQEISKTRE